MTEVEYRKLLIETVRAEEYAEGGRTSRIVENLFSKI